MRTRRITAPLEASSGFYHCMSRVVDRRFIFGDVEKEYFARLIRRYAQFCGIHILTYCLMGNHFHLLIEVPRRPDSPPDDAELLRRISAIYSDSRVQRLRRQWMESPPTVKESLRHRFWRRMGDLSQFLKELKQRFSQWHNLRQGRRGTLWEERFKSVLIGSDGSALSTIAAYIDLNPVRAGLVRDPARYRWSGYGEAAAGQTQALEGYQALMEAQGVPETPPKRAFLVHRERVLLYSHRRTVSERGSSSGSGNRTMPASTLTQNRCDGETPSREGPGRDLLHRIRFFTDGAVIGTRSFVDWIASRGRNGMAPKRPATEHPGFDMRDGPLFGLRGPRTAGGH